MPGALFPTFKLLFIFASPFASKFPSKILSSSDENVLDGSEKT